MNRKPLAVIILVAVAAGSVQAQDDDLASTLVPLARDALCSIFEICVGSGSGSSLQQPTLPPGQVAPSSAFQGTTQQQAQQALVFVGTYATGEQLAITFLSHNTLRIQYPGVDAAAQYFVQQMGPGYQVLSLYWQGMLLEQLHVQFQAQTTGIFRHDFLRTGAQVLGNFYLWWR